MENPYDKAHSALLERIVQNVTRLSEAVDNLNERMEEINKDNSDLAVVGQMFSSYWFSSQMYLQTTRKSSSDKK